MIIVLVTYNCKENCREKFLNAINEKGLGEKCRAEAGNYKYDYSFPENSSDVLLLTEIWKDEEALKVHGETAHLKEIQELKAVYVEKTEIRKFKGEPL